MKKTLGVILCSFVLMNSSVLFATQNTEACQGEFTNWKQPDYANQKQALGYNTDAFKVSDSEKLIIKFWIDIYTKYSTHHGVIHNLDYPEIVYEVVDFTDIDNNDSLSERKKEKQRKLLVNSAKERILFSLNKLAENDDIDVQNSYDRKLVAAFKVIPNSPKYRDAADMKSLRFQLGQSDRMREAIGKSGHYLPMMEAIFKKEGLPIELTRIVFVESSFDVKSYSKVGASGLWQIMPFVAKGNLKMNSKVDYRNHPIEATKLASKILKSNYSTLGLWPLAVTAYNHGTNGVKRLTELNQTKDLYEIIDTGTHTNSFGFASRNFYYSFLAALEVESSADVYFDDICKLTKIRLVEAVLPRAMKYKKLVEFFDGDSKLAFSFNPHFKKRIYANKTMMPKRAKILIPESSKKELLKLVGKTILVGGFGKKYAVEKGDTLTHISKQFKISVAQLLSWNELDHPNKIRVGQSLVISR